MTVPPSPDPREPSQQPERQPGRQPERPAVTCSAKGCGRDATWVLVWANPRIHTGGRTKTWAACEEHRQSLGDFLGVRGFLREVVALAEWERRTPAP